MSGAELRRFVGGPFPNLVPGRSPAGRAGRMARGPFPNLVPSSGRPGDQAPGVGGADAVETATTTDRPAIPA
jgi:hypothetical protein